MALSRADEPADGASRWRETPRLGQRRAARVRRAALGLVVAIGAGGYSSNAIKGKVRALFERIVGAARRMPVVAAEPVSVRTPATAGVPPPR